MGPPSNVAIKIRPWFLLALVLQLSLSVLHIMIGDIWGGVMVILVSFFGYQVYRDDMDPTWAMCYGIVIFMECIFDFVHLSIRISQVKEPFFKGYFYLDVVLVVAPVLSFIQAWMMYRVYTAFLDEEEQRYLMATGFPPPTYGAVPDPEQPFVPPPEQPPRQDAHRPSTGEYNAHDWNRAGQPHTL